MAKTKTLYCFDYPLGLQYSIKHVILLVRYPKNSLGYVTYFLKLGGELHYHTKT
jgi:hypothetical protein